MNSIPLPFDLILANGKRVIDCHIVFKNSQGHMVSFPIKGSIVMREKPRRLEYMIWNLDGKYTTLKDSNMDIKFTKEQIEYIKSLR